jgi:hypothetical protein
MWGDGTAVEMGVGSSWGNPPQPAATSNTNDYLYFKSLPAQRGTAEFGKWYGGTAVSKTAQVLCQFDASPDPTTTTPAPAPASGKDCSGILMLKTFVQMGRFRAKNHLLIGISRIISI